MECLKKGKDCQISALGKEISFLYSHNSCFGVQVTGMKKAAHLVFYGLGPLLFSIIWMST